MSINSIASYKQCKTCQRVLTRGNFAWGGRFSHSCHACNRERLNSLPRDPPRLMVFVGTYGLTVKQFNQMVIEQGGRCGICEAQLVDPMIDHDHPTGLVRGLLCRSCNQALGFLGDNIEGVVRALKYLERVETRLSAMQNIGRKMPTLPNSA